MALEIPPDAVPELGAGRWLGKRFRIERLLGRGGMGVVYEAFDRERHTRVALKVLRQLDPAAIFRFKEEFRALADLVHPNIVGLHELFVVDEVWFFTMDLVRGVGFLSFVREGLQAPWAEPSEPTIQLRRPSRSPAVGGGRRSSAAPSAALTSSLHADRLRAAVGQLAEGLGALHAAGKLHRDVKPTNVLVTPEGRVVLLDFGLVIELAQSGDTEEASVIGTATYMAPEQAAGLALTPASDWYAVGVMLYEALLGRPPFSGTSLETLIQKQEFEAPAPLEVEPCLPEDLGLLCADLLRRSPEERPGGHDILRRLGRASPAPGAALASTSLLGDPALVGCDALLADLRSALQLCQGGAAVTVLVQGPSGVGKSALVRVFLDDVARREEAVVLRGRCYERETVPFKALDSLVDGLSRFLIRLPRPEAEALLPPDAIALARMFPVLRRVEAISGTHQPPTGAVDPQRMRRRGFLALRELFVRMAGRMPVVLCIDDLQWGDLDSASLLAELLRPPEPPPILLLVCYRGDEVQTSPALSAFLAACAGRDPALVREVAVKPLTEAQARALAGMLLKGDPTLGEHAAAIARESGGSPFLVAELVRYVQVGERLAEGGGGISIEEVLAARLRQLPEAARRLLEIVALAGQPLSLGLATRAAELAGSDHRVIPVLRASHLIRSRTVRDREGIEPYHDRIRQALIAQLPPTLLQKRHHRLATELEASGQADPETLAIHFRAAGELLIAADHASAAAVRASAALAFDQAARLYRLAIELRPEGDPRSRGLFVRLGDALANAGRGREAARAYLAATPEATSGESLELRRLAAEQMLRAGHIEEGLAATGEVLGAVGMRAPGSRRATLLALAFRRAQLRLRGLGYRERDKSQIATHELTRIDVCWSVAIAMAFVDPLQGAYFQTRHLLLGLASGDPAKIVRGLLLEAGFAAAMDGTRGAGRAARLLAAAFALKERLGDPLVDATAAGMAGIVAFLVGDRPRARVLLEEGRDQFRAHCTGVAWELTANELYLEWALFYLGELAEVAQRVPALVAEAIERGDLYAATSLRLGLTNFAWLIVDDPAQARAAVEEATGQWAPSGYHLSHYHALLAECHVDLYLERPEDALARARAQWPALAGSRLLYAQAVGIEALFLRARCALGCAARSNASEPLLGAALHDARRLERTGVAYALPCAKLVRAAAAHLRGQHGHAVRWLAEAEQGFAAASMGGFAAAARRQRGRLVGGDEGAALIAAAEDWGSRQRVRRSDRVLDLLAPGFSREKLRE